MSIVIETTSDSLTEYAATNISILRQSITGNDGFIKIVFICGINYDKRTYQLDGQGNKLSLTLAEDKWTIPLDIPTFGPYFAQVCSEGDILGELVSNMADDLIRKSLVTRGILE